MDCGLDTHALQDATILLCYQLNWQMQKGVMLHVFVAGNSEFHWMPKLSCSNSCVFNCIEIDSARLGFLSGYSLRGVKWDLSFTFVVKLT